MRRSSADLITTKLHRPVVKGDHMHRPRLIGLLDSGRDLPLTLISAPAGSGKTTLLADWLAGCPCPSAWLSLDEEDRDITLFVRYIIAALRTIVPNACPHTLDTVEAGEHPPLHVLASRLINEIEDLQAEPGLAGEERFVLVLDDYNLASGQAVNELLTELLRHPLQAMRLVISTRSDPPLPLASLRARGQLAEVRSQDLRFSKDETQAYLEQATHQPVSDDVAGLLAGSTEGWITGLHLAVLNMRQATDSRALLAGIDGSQRYVVEYLMDEVLACQPQPVQAFLMKTSLLDRLCGPLCEVVTGQSNNGWSGQATLSHLDQANLFVVALDDEQRWYRYHQLFQQFLRHRLEQQCSPAEIADLHRKASAWFAGHQFVEEAIAHALAAGDGEVVAHIVDTHLNKAMNEERWLQLERWQRLIPRHLVDVHPELLLLDAWVLQRQWRLPEIGPVIDRIEVLLADGRKAPSRRMQGEIAALRAQVSYYRMEGEMTTSLADHALQLLPMDHSSARGLAWMYAAGGRQSSGDMNGARAALNTGLQEDRHHLNSFPSRVLIALCVLEWMAGNPAGLKQAATHFLKLAEERDLMESVWWARHFSGVAAYLVNDLTTAQRDFAAVARQRYIAHSLPYSQAAYGLASVLQAQGADEQANALIRSVLEYGMEIGNLRVQLDARSFLAWLAFQQGNQAEAQAWADSTGSAILGAPMTMFHHPDIALARILIGLKTTENLNRAARLLARLCSYVDATHNTRFKVEIMALEALRFDALGQQDKALAALQEAVKLALPGGLVRVFLDLGAPMAGLLDLLVQKDRVPPAAAQFLTTFSSSPAPVPEPELQPITEPLTLREQEILELLAQRLAAKEIAQQLIISDRTVKRHTANIYVKLGVHNRQEAIAAATAMGILPGR